jgi:ABC-type antimicrobial peptide transport system permease subunit
MFGVFVYAVQQRTREIGIRMALGAQPAQVIRLVLADSARAVAGGFLAGFAASAGSSQLLTAYIHGISPFDSRAYFSVAIILAAAALMASWLPSRRAAGIDPSTTLRHE